MFLGGATSPQGGRGTRSTTNGIPEPFATRLSKTSGPWIFSDRRRERWLQLHGGWGAALGGGPAAPRCTTTSSQASRWVIYLLLLIIYKKKKMKIDLFYQVIALIINEKIFKFLTRCWLKLGGLFCKTRFVSRKSLRRIIRQ